MIRPAAAGLVLGMITACILASAGPAHGQGAGSGASTVLRIPPSPRALALGNAMVAVQDLWSREYNPAASAETIVVGAAYQTLPVGASAGAMALTAPVRSDLVLGLSLRFVDYGEIDVIEPDPTGPVGHPTGATARGGELAALFGGAATVGPLRLGLAGRWLRLEVAGLVDDALAADAGAVLDVGRGLSLAASAQNIAGTLEAGRAAPLPRTFRGGASLTGARGPLSGLLAIEGRHREARTGVGAGLELGAAWDSMEAVGRLGFETRPHSGDAYSRFTFGGGVRVDRLSIDLAYRALGPLGSTRQVGIGYRF